MNRRSAKALAYSDHQITYQTLKDRVCNADETGMSKTNKALPRKTVLDLFKQYFNALDSKSTDLNKVINSTCLKRHSCSQFTLTPDGMIMVNILRECG